MKLAFILGTNPTLSIAEILSKLNSENLSFSILSISREALVLNSDLPLADPKKFLDSLGGSIKIVEISKESINFLPQVSFLDDFLGALFPSHSSGKITFGISAYGFNSNIKNLLGAFAIEKKKSLRGLSIVSRYVPLQKEPYLSSVQVTKNNLIQKGFEIDLIKTKELLFAGKTLAVQDFEAYNLRDFGRPFSDPHSGMLPPKIAQIMVNLTGLPSIALLKPITYNLKPVLYDPFCGSGTILQEALLLGFDIFGSDNDQDAIKRTKGNLEWLRVAEVRPRGPLEVSPRQLLNNLDEKIFLSDIQAFNQYISADSVEAIVTEPQLGPPLRHLPSPNEAEAIINDLLPLYLSALKNVYTVLKKNGVLVMIFPKIGNTRLLLLLLDEIKKIGYDLFCPIPKEVIEQNADVLKEISSEGTIFYARPDAKIIREIIVLTKR